MDTIFKMLMVAVAGYLAGSLTCYWMHEAMHGHSLSPLRLIAGLATLLLLSAIGVGVMVWWEVRREPQRLAERLKHESGPTA